MVILANSFFFFEGKYNHSLAQPCHYSFIITLLYFSDPWWSVYTSFCEGKKYQEEDPTDYCHQPSIPYISPNTLPGVEQEATEWKWAQKNPVSQLLKVCGERVTTYWSLLPRGHPTMMPSAEPPAWNYSFFTCLPQTPTKLAFLWVYNGLAYSITLKSKPAPTQSLRTLHNLALFSKTLSSHISGPSSSLAGLHSVPQT